MKALRTTLEVGIEFFLYLALWFLFVGKLVFVELVVGVVAAAIATLASWIVFESSLAKMVCDPKLWLEAWHLPWMILQGTGEIMAVLAKHVTGVKRAESLLRAVDFDAGSEDSARDATRRALATAYTTVAPNFVVIGIDRERRFLLFHQIERSEVPALTKHLGAEAPEQAS